MGSIFAIGRNYVKHIEELGNQMPTEPVTFSKAPSSLTTDSILNLPSCLGSIHFETELVLEIGSDVPLNGSPDLSVIRQMTLGIDFTARDYQKKLKEKGLPWFLAKSFQDGCYLGPLKKPIHEPIRFQLYQNEQLVQDGDTRQMMFPIPEILHFINQSNRLSKGDLIYTGTPAGVGPVNHGDQLKICCEALGIQETLEINFV